MTVREWKEKSGFDETAKLYSDVLDMYNKDFNNGVIAISKILGIDLDEIMVDIEDHYKVARIFIEEHMRYMQDRLIYVFKTRK